MDLSHTEYQRNLRIPTFFEQIMVPGSEFMTRELIQPPPNIMTWMPENDWLGDLDLFSTDFTPIIDQTLDWQNDILGGEREEAGEDTGVRNLQRINHDDSARKRHAIFQRSPW